MDFILLADFLLGISEIALAHLLSFIGKGMLCPYEWRWEGNEKRDTKVSRHIIKTLNFSHLLSHFSRLIFTHIEMAKS